LIQQDKEVKEREQAAPAGYQKPPQMMYTQPAQQLEGDVEKGRVRSSKRISVLMGMGELGIVGN